MVSIIKILCEIIYFIVELLINEPTVSIVAGLLRARIGVYWPSFLLPSKAQNRPLLLAWLRKIQTRDPKRSATFFRYK